MQEMDQCRGRAGLDEGGGSSKAWSDGFEEAEAGPVACIPRRDDHEGGRGWDGGASGKEAREGW